MTWARFGDTSATHPKVMAIDETTGADERSRLEVFGFVTCAATQSGAHDTDYEVSLGTARLLAGSRAQLLLDQAVEAGLLKTRRRAGRVRYFIIEDPEFIHLRKKAEKDWEKRRKADTTNPSLIGPARIRDGDACRYCSNVVSWEARTGARRGTHDHRIPGVGARSPEDLVVACGSCNSRRSKDPDADLYLPLLPPPPEPFFTEHSAKFLESIGYPTTRPTATTTPRPAQRPDPAPRPPQDTATGTTPGQRPSTPSTDTAATGQRPAPATSDPATPGAPTSSRTPRKRSRRGRSRGGPPGGDDRAAS